MLAMLLLHCRLQGALTSLCGLVLVFSLCGCGKQKQPWEEVYAVEGVVTHKGKPVAGADISLFPQAEWFPDSIRPRAKSNEDGSFVLWTYERGDGAPAGSYKVVVVHHEIVESKGVANTKPNDLPPQYSRVATTDLIVEINADNSNKLNLDL